MNTLHSAVAWVALAAAGAAQAEPRTLVVCPEAAQDTECTFRGGGGIQQAVDAAASGDTVRLRAGSYTAGAYREVPYQQVKVRGFVVIDGKDLVFEGEPGAVLDGATGVPTTAVVVRNAEVTVRNLTLTGQRYDVQEDDFYEGHGLFAIDAQVRAEDLTISKFQKMGLTGRGDTVLLAKRLQIVDGHVGIWLHETAYLSLADSEVSRNDGTAIAAYDNSVAHVVNSRFEDHPDDALYSEHRATIYAIGSRIARNKPYGARAVGDSTIWLENCVLEGNEKDTTGAEGAARVRIVDR